MDEIETRTHKFDYQRKYLVLIASESIGFAIIKQSMFDFESATMNSQ